MKLQNGFPIAILKGDIDSRLKYYSALETAQVEHNKESFINLIIQNLEEMLQRMIRILGNL